MPPTPAIGATYWYINVIWLLSFEQRLASIELPIPSGICNYERRYPLRGLKGALYWAHRLISCSTSKPALYEKAQVPAIIRSLRVHYRIAIAVSSSAGALWAEVETGGTVCMTIFHILFEKCE